MDRTKDKTVCLTDEAHGLLSGMANDRNSTMKEVAIEAIALLAQGGQDKEKEWQEHIKQTLSVAVGTIAGVIIGVML